MDQNSIFLHMESKLARFTAALIVGLFLGVFGIGFFKRCDSLPLRLPFRKGHARSAFNQKVDSFKDQFPPCRRQAIASGQDEQTREVRCRLKGPSPLPAQLQSRQLPSTKTQDLGKSGQYTPTGFSTEDIEALGAFPDYSALSGVPHPKPCPGFDITTASFRPFRPFRFSYHQTMGKQICSHPGSGDISC